MLSRKLKLIEGFTRYDKSKLWDIHDYYFQNIGVKAWTGGDLPYSGVTNFNEAYKKAKLIIENLKIIRKDGASKPIRILEVGGGHGEFASNFLAAFQSICEHEDLDYFEYLEYCFTDYSEKTVMEVEDSGKLDEYLDKITFAEMDVLDISGWSLGTFDVVMSTYLLDQLPARIFASSKGEFLEKYIKLEDDEKRIKELPEEFREECLGVSFHDVFITDSQEKQQEHDSEMSFASSFGLNLTFTQDVELPPRKWVKKIKRTYDFRPVDFERETIEEEGVLGSVQLDELDALYNAFRKEKDSTIVYSYGALRAVKNFMKLIKPSGLIICSDFNASTKPGVDIYEPCYYGNSIAQAVNFELIFNYFSDSRQKVLLYEDPIRPLHTMILTRADYQFALELGEKYNAVFKQNLFVRALYKYLVELQLSFYILAAFMFAYLIYWFVFK